MNERIAFLHFDPSWSGRTQVFATVAHELGARGYDATLIVPADSEVAALVQRSNAEILPVAPSGFPWMRDARLRKAIGDRAFDTFFVHSPAEQLAAAAIVRRSGHGAVVRRLGAGEVLDHERMPAGADRIAATRYLYTSESPPSGHAAPSRRLSPLRAELGVTIPLKPAAELSSGAPDETWWLACIATREAIRRATNVVRAAAFLAQRQPKLRIRVIGSAASDPDFRVLAGALGLGKRVDWVPHPPSLAHALRGVAVGWVIADGDDAGLGVLHLMANSVVVLAERSTVASHYVADGIHGALVRQLDPPVMAAETSVLLADVDRRRAMGAAGRSRAEREFPLRAMLAGFEQAARATRERRTPT
jgi:hypothetical protein